MTFTEIVQDVMNRLNLTSEEARVRIGVRVNDRYRRVTSSIGLVTSRRKTETFLFNPTLLGNTLPDITFEGYEKILRITRLNDKQQKYRLAELTWDEVTGFQNFTVEGEQVDDPTNTPRAYGVKRMGPDYVTITLDFWPKTQPFRLQVEGYEKAVELVDDLEPDFPEDFHDILIAGAMADELWKMEKAALAQAQEQKYEMRLSDLRMFIARSSYLDIVQGKDKPRQLWYRPWYSRITI